MEHVADFGGVASTGYWNLKSLSPWVVKPSSMSDFERVSAQARPLPESWPTQGHETWPYQWFLQDSPPYLPWEGDSVASTSCYSTVGIEDSSDATNELMFPRQSSEVVYNSSSARSPTLADAIQAFPPPGAAQPTNSRKRRKHKPKKGNLIPFSMLPSDEASSTDQRAGQTVMIRHIACSYTQEQVMAFLDEAGFRGKYNFVYLPSNPAKNANLGYAFVNFASEEYVNKCKDHFDGKVFGTSCTQKKCQVALAHMQGYSMISRHAMLS